MQGTVYGHMHMDTQTDIRIHRWTSTHAPRISFNYLASSNIDHPNNQFDEAGY